MTLEVTRRSLVASALEAVQQVHWPRVYFERALDDETPEPVLRTLLVCALAMGCTGSSEIICAIPDKPVLNYLSVGFVPKFQTIHDFRRRNQEAIRAALALTLAKCISAVPWAVRSLDVQAETAARLERAIRADSMALDV
jgi:hypothetical protein